MNRKRDLTMKEKFLSFDCLNELGLEVLINKKKSISENEQSMNFKTA